MKIFSITFYKSFKLEISMFDYFKTEYVGFWNKKTTTFMVAMYP